MISETAITIGVTPPLEGRLAVPAAPAAGVVLCHPHPLYGGDLENPVLVRASEVCLQASVATLRFNFRGVGKSGGAHGGGVAEQDDVRAALDRLAEEIGSLPLAVTGYSFGAWVAATAACREPRVQSLALIAPPLGLYDFGCLEGKRVPTLFATGDRDPYCPMDDFQRFTARYPWVATAIISGADHFFFGKLYPLGEVIGSWARGFAAEARRSPAGQPKGSHG